MRRDIRPGERGHSSRVALLARAIAVEMDHGDPEDAYLAGLLHDVGKTLLPWDPATIPRQLTNIETGIVQTHSALGARAAEQAGVSLDVVQGILFHHERLDGSGYPAGLVGEAVPVLSLIVAVADIYDALANVRPYKPAWPISQVHAHIRRQAGRSLPRDVVVAVLDVAAGGFDPMERERP